MPFFFLGGGDLGSEKSKLSRYDIRAEGALPSSITVIARVKQVGPSNIYIIISGTYRPAYQS